MSTATAEPTEAVKPSGFAAALEAAFTDSETTKPEPVKAEAKVTEEKTEPVKTEVKTGTPRELFKKADAAKADEPKSPIDDIAEPVFKDAKGKAGWEALKGEAKTWQGKAAQLEKQIADAKAAGRDPETLEARLASHEKKIAEYDTIVSRARLEDHPDFRREFIDGRAKVVTKAQAIVEESGGDKDAIALALNLRGKARADAIRDAAGDLDPFQAARLGRAIDELTDLDERADVKRADSAKAYEEMRDVERKRDSEARANLAKTKFLEFDDTSRSLKAELEVLNRADGHDEWNARAEAILRDAKAAVEANPHTNIRAEIEARALPVYRQLFIEADDKVSAYESKIAELESELKSIHGKSPGLASRAAGQEGAKKSFSETLASAFEG